MHKLARSHDGALIGHMVLSPAQDAIPVLALVLDVEVGPGENLPVEPPEGYQGHVTMAHQRLADCVDAVICLRTSGRLKRRRVRMGKAGLTHVLETALGCLGRGVVVAVNVHPDVVEAVEVMEYGEGGEISTAISQRDRGTIDRF